MCDVEEKALSPCLDVSWSKHATVLHVFEALFSVASVAHISVNSKGWVVKVCDHVCRLLVSQCGFA